MASSYQWNFDYDESLTEDYGLAFSHAGAFLISKVGALTHGFVYDKSDIWINAEDCQAVTWTSADNC